MEIPCVFRNHTFLDNNSVYVCEFTMQNIPEEVQILPKGLHKLDERNKRKTNANVVGVIFTECNLSKVPQGLTAVFPNFCIFSIWRSNLKNVTKDDLAEYKNIKRLGFCNNDIEYLPGDLFEGFKNLEEISFNGNKIKLIEPNILDGLNKLKLISFINNLRYNEYFSMMPGSDMPTTLEDLKANLNVKFIKYHNRPGNRFQTEFMNFLQSDETYKDFCIKINNREFNVHKLLLVARSPTFAEILKNNPNVGNLNLVDIPEEIFEKILHFLYTDELPHDEGLNFLDLFAAAGKLKIKFLIEFAAKKLIQMMETKNAFEILKLSNRYDHEELRQASFAKIKADYPELEFKDEWANNMEIMIKIVEAYRIKVAIMKKAEEDFEELIRKY